MESQRVPVTRSHEQLTQHDVGFPAFFLKSVGTVKVTIYQADVWILARNLGTLVTASNESCDLVIFGMLPH